MSDLDDLLQDPQRLLKRLKELQNTETGAVAFDTFGLTHLLNQVDDSRPQWVRDLAKKIQDAFHFTGVRGKSPAWKEGARFGMFSIAAGWMRENPEIFDNCFSSEHLNFVLSITDYVIQDATKSKLLTPSTEANDYFDGFAYGRKEGWHPSRFPAVGTHRLFLDLFLVMAWRLVEKCENTTDLYQQILGDDDPPPQWLGDLDSFQSYCRAVGLKLGSPGRPKQKP